MDNRNTSQEPSDSNLQPSSGADTNGSQSPEETTYWESQKPSEPETPEQFYQYYQQQMNSGTTPQNQPQKGDQPQSPGGGGNSQGFTPGSYPQPAKKKTRGKLTFLFVLLILILAGAGTAYAFKDTLLNTLALYTKSPAKYYEYVETKSLETAIDELSPQLDLINKSYAADVTTDITFNRDSLDSLMQSTFGMSLADVETMIGIPIENVGMNFLVGTDGTKTSENIGIRLNSVDLITLELFMDMAKQEVFFRLPELSPAYIKQSLASEASGLSLDKDLSEVMTAERNIDLLKRYSEILIQHMNNAVLEKNAELSVDTLTVSCSKITLTITEEDMRNAVTAILQEAKEDEYLIELLPMFNLTKEDYVKAIDDALTELQNTTSSSSTDTLGMIVYVDSRGHIVGREFSVTSSQTAFGYNALNKGNLDEYNFYVKDENGNTVLQGKGNQVKEENAYDGALTISVSDPSSETFSDISVDITYEDVRTEKLGNQVFHYGSYNLTSLDLMGIQIMMENTVEDEVQNNKITLQLGASPLVVINTKSDYLEDYQITPPPADAMIFDTTQYESYLSTMDIEAYLKSLSDKLGIDLNSLLAPYLSGAQPE